MYFCIRVIHYLGQRSIKVLFSTILVTFFPYSILVSAYSGKLRLLWVQWAQMYSRVMMLIEPHSSHLYCIEEDFRNLTSQNDLLLALLWSQPYRLYAFSGCIAYRLIRIFDMCSFQNRGAWLWCYSQSWFLDRFSCIFSISSYAHNKLSRKCTVYSEFIICLLKTAAWEMRWN